MQIAPKRLSKTKRAPCLQTRSVLSHEKYQLILDSMMLNAWSVASYCQSILYTIKNDF